MTFVLQSVCVNLFPKRCARLFSTTNCRTLPSVDVQTDIMPHSTLNGYDKVVANSSDASTCDSLATWSATNNSSGALLERGSRFLVDQWRRMQDSNSLPKSMPVLKFAHPIDLKQTLNLSVRDEADSEDEIMQLCSTVAKYSLKGSHAHNYNQLWHGVDEPGLLGAWFADTFNTQAFTYEVAPAFSLIEAFLLEHISTELVGYDRSSADGTMCPGGSLANMYGLSLARHRVMPSAKHDGMALSTAASDDCDQSTRISTLVGFTSRESHYSVRKGMAFMGFGEKNLIAIECDEQGRMRVDKLEDAIQHCRKAGDTPFFVNATSGTTVLGAFDPLDKLADICARENLWLHCDGAWGGAAILVPELRQTLMRGLERCDSVLWNPHKMLCLPLQCSVFVTRHRGLLAEAHSARASYLFQPDKFYDTSYDTGDKVVQCGRHVDAFKLYLKWRALGTRGLQSEVERAFEQAKVLANLIQNHENFELVLPYSNEQCTNVCFWYVPPAMRRQWKLKAKEGVKNCLLEERRKNSVGEMRQKMGSFETALHLVAPEVKKRMMLAGTLMVGYQPSGTLNLPNFFRMIVQCVPAPTEADMAFVVDEIDRLGRDIVC